MNRLACRLSTVTLSPRLSSPTGTVAPSCSIEIWFSATTTRAGPLFLVLFDLSPSTQTKTPANPLSAPIWGAKGLRQVFNPASDCPTPGLLGARNGPTTGISPCQTTRPNTFSPSTSALCAKASQQQTMRICIQTLQPRYPFTLNTR